jgi:putative copper export protein
MQAEPLLHWPEPVTQFTGFVGLFLANGAIGFRYAVVRTRLTARPAEADEVPGIYPRATQRAAMLGLLGALVQTTLFIMQLPNAAARAHLSTGQLVTADPPTAAKCVLLAAAITGFALAGPNRWSGWPLAAVGFIGAQFTALLAARWASLVNAVHALVGGLWIGTLAVLLVAGLATVLSDAARGRRGQLAADMVNGFSPLALRCGVVLVLSGLITAWLHLDPLSSLWSTPYGYTLLAKLCVVAVVFGLGGWNWRRQRPRLGSEEAAGMIRRSSIMEVSVATVVLMITAILVSLPAPRPPRSPGTSPPAPNTEAHSSL